ncbi:VOC family protein [Nisaea nitritireducens]|uniref:VOC family protein n=1 Tax=Nisaea nitritireducens TaxID=568392 RepID=UPI0029C0A110|nr:VOC family protein [Nisaea nitritireducens]
MKRIVANLAVPDVAATTKFYRDLFDLELEMDLGWIATLGSEEHMRVQFSLMREGGSGAPVPDISVEVDDLDGMLEKVKAAGYEIEYGPADEPWGVRRFYLRDPEGRLVNVLTHL